MDVLRPAVQKQMPPGGRLAVLAILAIVFCGFVLLEQPCPAALPGAVEADSFADGDVTAGSGPSYSAGNVVDVSLLPDGALSGRVVDFGTAPGQDNVAAVQVELLTGRRTVALARTDRHGRFGFENVRPGPYQIVVRSGDGPSRWFLRAWSASSAPPHAQKEIVVSIGGLIVRGQHPIVLPVVSLRQAATVTGLVAGAVAAPMIYHNSLVDNRVPTSP
ncbi:MAG TPA: carboxypeptidase-like regulatory domain-containing protein [Thermoguttaceae bacterium]|nr:carboxypeptidase-like regulatory domain-containing protein [Thermoguttaceae bacterium]